MARTLVIVPTYNEAENIEEITARLHLSGPGAHLLIVDDGSPDGTGELADALAAADPRVFVLHRKEKAGLGAAYLAGFAWGLERGYDFLVEMDADGSHDPADVGRLLAGLNQIPDDLIGWRHVESDVVLGSRWVPGGKVVNWPRRREALSRLGNLYVRLALGLDIRDATGGFRVYRREVLEAIDYASVTSQGYCFQVDLVQRAIRAGFTVREVPITFVERTRGESKMSGNIIGEALSKVTVWGAAYRWGQIRGKVVPRALQRA